MLDVSIDLQLDRCSIALKMFSRCMKERKWNKLPDHVDRVSREMEQLRQGMIESPNLDDDILAQVKYLEIQLRRTQRQLAVHIGAVDADISTLGSGIRQASVAKALLQES